MRLTSFRAQNFKSLIDVELPDLQDINVFYGPNNVGKSNILQAMDVFFELLTAFLDHERFLIATDLLPDTTELFEHDDLESPPWGGLTSA
jgi:AAA15 family ATPase/GTPase